MITEFLMNVFTAPARFLISTLPSMSSISIPESAYTGINELIDGVAYVLPIAQLMPIIYITVSMGMAKITWALIIRVKSFVPTMGA